MTNCEQIFDEEAFVPAIIADISNAKGLVLIKSTYVAAKRIAKMIPAMKRSISRGVHIVAYVQDPTPEHFNTEESQQHLAISNAAASMLTAIGVELNYIPKVHEKVAVIDDCVSWSGSLNILSFNNTSEEMTRYVSRWRVKDTIKRHRLVHFATKDGRRPEWAVPPKREPEAERKSFGVYLATRRRSLQMSQRSLAKASGVSPGTLCEIENGVVDAKLTTIARICHALDCVPRVIPAFLLPTVSSASRNNYHGTLVDE
jgi:DNA-binding XRE family transcriptional regulator